MQLRFCTDIPGTKTAMAVFEILQAYAERRGIDVYLVETFAALTWCASQVRDVTDSVSVLIILLHATHTSALPQRGALLCITAEDAKGILLSASGMDAQRTNSLCQLLQLRPGSSVSSAAVSSLIDNLRAEGEKWKFVAAFLRESLAAQVRSWGMSVQQARSVRQTSSL
jgi:hypothetical protein